MKTKLITLILFSAFLSAPSSADDASAQWASKCTFDKIHVTFEAKSKSGDPYEDDMYLYVQIDKKKLPVTIGMHLFWPLVPPKQLSACDKIIGVPINKNQSLLLFSVDDRPSLDNLAGLLIDIPSGKILDLKKNLGAFFRLAGEKKIQIEKTESGFRALMAQGWNKTAKSDSAKEVFMGWVNVGVKDGHIIARWEKPLPSTHAQYSNPDVQSALAK